MNFTAIFLLLFFALVAEGNARNHFYSPPLKESKIFVSLDSLEGKWLGTLEYSPEKYAPGKYEIGLEFRRENTKEWKSFFYQPIMNFYGLELPGGIKQNGEAIILEALGMSLTLHNGIIKGTGFSGGVSVVLQRTDKLPSEPPMPNFPKGPNPKWQVKLGSPIYATAAVRDSTVYIGTTGGVFQAIRITDGKFIWTFSAGRPIHGEALVTEEAVYFVCDNGFMFKLNRNTGKELWRYDLGDAQVSRILPHQAVNDRDTYDTKSPKPILLDTILYIGSGNGSFHAVSASTGKQVWRTEAQGKIRTDAFAFGAYVIFGTWDNFLYALDRATGKEVWKKDMKGTINGTPTLIDGKLIVGTRGAVLYGLNPATSDILWRSPFFGSWVESSPVVSNGLMYIGSSDLRRVTCYDPNDARILWRTDVYGWTWNRPCVTDKFVYLGVGGTNPYMTRHSGSVTALDKKTGILAWRIAVPEPVGQFQNGFVAAPILEGKTLVIGGLDGSLYAFVVE